MDNSSNQSSEIPSEQPEKKHNFGAKLAVSVGLGGFVGGKLAIPGAVIDLNGMFPKGTSLGSKFKQVFSKDVIPLIEKAITQQLEKGRSPSMAMLASMKWSLILPTVGGIVLGVIGWKRADRIADSKDIIKHPIKSTKIILGLEEPDSEIVSKKTDESKGKHADAVLARRAAEEAKEITR